MSTRKRIRPYNRRDLKRYEVNGEYIQSLDPNHPAFYRYGVLTHTPPNGATAVLTMPKDSDAILEVVNSLSTITSTLSKNRRPQW